MQAQAHCQDPTIAASHPGAEKHKASHLLYQSVTALAMLLFLFSFWSC
jgi:hypothetical protein